MECLHTFIFDFVSMFVCRFFKRFPKCHDISRNMMTLLENSHDLEYYFDLFWKYLWWVRDLPSLKLNEQVLLEKNRGWGKGITKSNLQTNQKQAYEYIWIWQKFTV